MFDLIMRFIKWILPVLRTSVIQVAADTLNDLAYPSSRRRFPSRRFSPSYVMRSPFERQGGRVTEPNPFPPGSPNHLRHQAGLDPIINEKSFHDVLMVAFDLTGPNSGIVHEWLHNHMPTPNAGGYIKQEVVLDSWWVANDERFDGSDCDSAVFVPKGKQSEAVAILKKEGLYE